MQIKVLAVAKALGNQNDLDFVNTTHYTHQAPSAKSRRRSNLFCGGNGTEGAFHLPSMTSIPTVSPSMPAQTCPASFLRSAYGEPTHRDGGQGLPSNLSHKINFRHPGYDNDSNVLLILPGLDGPNGGIHHETARIACGILANNNWAGFFTEDKEGKQKVGSSDAILHKKNYYFHVSSDANEKYAIVPSFSDWIFPHGNIPASWKSCDIPSVPERRLPRESSSTESLLARDVSCRLTDHIEGTEHAHLIPRTESTWFYQNSMALYGDLTRLGGEYIDDPGNAILLRSDMHTIFDQKRFVLVPKPSSTTPPIWSFVVHLTTSGSCRELATLYHNVALQPLTGIAIQYLLARFAWTIFGSAKVFLLCRVKRFLCLTEDGQSKIRELSGDECMAHLRQVNSKSGSSKKRKLATLATEERQEDDEKGYEDDEEGCEDEEEGYEDEEYCD